MLLKQLRSIYISDCDFMGHLNNMAYIKYMFHAREDMLLEQLKLDLMDLVRTERKAFHIIQNQIAYFAAVDNEKHVVCTSEVIDYDSRFSTVEYQVRSQDERIVHALMWTKFAFVDMDTNRITNHTPFFQQLFETHCKTDAEKNWEARSQELRKQNSRP